MSINSTLQFLQTLKEIGLTANEANVYISLHAIGQNPASTLAKKAALNRSSCYTILNSLIQKGFIQQTIKSNITYFTATDPKHVIQHLKTKKTKIDENIENLGNFITHFKSLHSKSSKKPKVVFFEGCQGIKNSIEDSLTSTEEIRIYSSIKELKKILPNYFPKHYKTRTEKGVLIKAIFPACKESYRNKLRDKYENRETRLIPPELDFHLDIMIYDNKVVITSLKEQFGLLIESEEMATAQKKIYDLVWEGTKKYDTTMTQLMKKEFATKKPSRKTEGFF